MPHATPLHIPAVLAAALVSNAALAQDGAKPCTLSGKAEMPVNLVIYDKADGGNAIARFTGGETRLALSQPFAQGGKRAHVATGTGAGSFRVDGWTDVTKVPIFTSRNVPIVAGHVWIGAHRQVEVTASSGNRFKIQKRVESPLRQTFNGWADCSALTLSGGTPAVSEVPGNARGYVLRKDTAELYDTWAKDKTLVTVLNKAPDATGVLLWSEEQRGGFVRVTYHGEVMIDAWARSAELRALPRGETMDVARPAVTKSQPPRLALANNPKVVTTQKELPLRIAAREDGQVIGVVEPVTELYVLDVVAGWASVLPKSLHVAPHGDGQFWVKNSELRP